jgi:hypothetical protein
MRPYSKKTIEDAILICDVRASNPDAWSHAYTMIDLDIRLSSTSVKLAMAAYDAVDNVNCHYGSEVWAEAAQLIREGYRIGDSVERLPRQLTLPGFDDLLKKTYSPETVTGLAFTSKPPFSGLVKDPTSLGFKTGYRIVFDETSEVTPELVAEVLEERESLAAPSDTPIEDGDYGADS